jgi:TrkA-N domain
MSLLARLVPARKSQRANRLGGTTPGGRRIDKAWRWFVDQVSSYRWWIAAAAAIAAFVLGCIGWWEYKVKAHPTAGDPAFIAYWSLKDFLMNSPSDQVIPWQLNVARFLAPLVAGWAGYSALASLFRDRVQQMRIPLMRRHVVICGLGRYVGTIFLRHLRENDIRVVVIEQDVANPNIELCRGMGVPVIIGDAQRQKTLQAAGAHRAWRVLAVADDDGVNTQIVATWRKLTGPGSRHTGCLARISDPDYCSLLRLQDAHSGNESWVDFFNIDEIGARLILKKFPIVTDCAQPHILVAHLDPLGVWLVWHAARTWYDKGDKKTPLLVTVMDHDPDKSLEALKSQHPALKKHCEFKLFHATAEHIREQLPAYHLDPATPPISCAYVTAYQDRQAFDTALKLHHELHRLDPSVPVVLALSRPQGVADLLADAKKAGALAGLEVFATMENACSVEVLQGGSYEPLAEEIHQRWRNEQLKGRKPAPLWDDLDDSRKESSRDQARDIGAKLRSIDCAFAPLRDWDAKEFKFFKWEVEKLAVDEHQRWWDERRDNHWVLIPMPVGKDDEEVKGLVEEAKRRKESPYLISWGDLLDQYPEIAEYDRVFIREIPELLASVGLQVVRTDTATTASPAQQAMPA